MRTLLAILLALSILAATALAGEKVSFKLPDPGGNIYGVQDFKSRYLLLVYQGIP
jgi:hypothetical protein